MTQFFKIRPCPFNGFINVWSGDFASMAEEIEKKNKGKNITDDLFEPGDLASTLRIYTTDGLMICVFLGPETTDQILYHECLHAAWYVLDNAGVELDADNHEALAYMQSYLFEQITKKLK